ncbi:hypothetical protein [Sphingobacterium multivorum]|uniref:hypothetical protein n=1 Tax=Sphingobacterium multivorum TaxID=28454 RepID=UPI003DA297A2
MKKVLFLVLLVVPFLGFAQKRKTTSNGATVSNEEKLKIKTLKWFRDVYVEENWKDPYSYKLMKCTLTPVLFVDHLKSVREDLVNNFNEIDTTKSASVYNKAKWNTIAKKKQYDKDLLGVDSSMVYFSKLEYNQALHQETELKKMHSTYVNEIAEIDSLQKHSSKELLNKIYQYSVYIDAYGKNGYGNVVLNRYRYVINDKGVPLGDVESNE